MCPRFIKEEPKKPVLALFHLTQDPKDGGSQFVPQNSVATTTFGTKQQNLKIQKSLLLLLNYFNYFGVL